MTPTLLFDIDGTLVETDHLHFQAFNETFAEHGVAVDWDTYRSRIIGKVNPVIAAEFIPHVPSDLHAGIMEEKEAHYRQAATALEAAPGLVALLDWARAAGLRCAAVTNAPRDNADHVLEALGLRDRFHALVIGPELADAKPHPRPYLRGLELLDGDPARSVAFEDSPAGVRSAAGAGLAVVGLTTSVEADVLRSVGASVVAGDFRDPVVLDFVRRRTGLAA